jgi:LmbE family N-acetylglucosaminyl deacetylase
MCVTQAIRRTGVRRAHPDDVEVAMGGTIAKLSDKGLTTLLVDLCDGERTRHASRGARQGQAAEAARILGVTRLTLDFADRLIQDIVEARFEVARLIRVHPPRYVFTTKGSGVHPDHQAVTDIVVNGVFYARFPKWDEVNRGHCQVNVAATLGVASAPKASGRCHGVPRHERARAQKSLMAGAKPMSSNGELDRPETSARQHDRHPC